MKTSYLWRLRHRTGEFLRKRRFTRVLALKLVRFLPARFFAQNNILDEYVRTPPCPGNAVEIFKGEWLSRLPGDLSELTGGGARLFEDPRIAWFSEQIGGFEDRSVLELGPLEGGHAYMAEKGGAASVFSIESNTRAYLKCLIVKEMLGLDRVTFACGDFIPYLEGNHPRFDVCLASGVLYHMDEPLKVLHRLSQTSDRLFIWTHYYDAERVHAIDRERHRFSDAGELRHEGFSCRGYRREYRELLYDLKFCGGTRGHSIWLPRDAIIDSLKHFGFEEVRIGCEEPDHSNGPAFAVAALRKSG